VQVIESFGTGNGTRMRGDNLTAVVRGKWRVGFKNSGEWGGGSDPWPLALWDMS
jgi:hypothetical protein